MTSWFTFGQVHVHSVNGKTFDKDCIVEITSNDPRATMVQYFGRTWAMEYEKEQLIPEFLSLFPRGIIKL